MSDTLNDTFVKAENELEGWIEMRLDEFADINPSTKLSKGTIAKNVPMDAVKPFTKTIPNYEFKKYSGGVKFINEDTLMARITPSLENGKTSYVNFLGDEEVGFGSTEFIVLRAKEGLSDSQYLYYLSTTPELREVAIQSMTGSSGRQRVQNDVVKEFKFLFPLLSEQKEIAKVLSGLDNKIDLLQRQNKTLEELSKAMFRQSFIEKSNDSWNKEPLSIIANHLKISVKPSRQPNTIYKHFSLPAYDSNQMPFLETGNSIRSNKYLVKEGTILISKLNPRFPRIWLNLKNVDEVSICSTEFQVVEPKDLKNLGFVFCFLNSDEVSSELEMSASGTSGSHQRVRPEDIFNLTYLTPNSKYISDFSENVLPYLEKLVQNRENINTLEKLRDTLLPKLMSGEVRVNL